MVRTDLPDKVMANLLEPSESDETLLTRWSHCVLTDSPSATLGRGQLADIPPPQVNARIVLRYDVAQPADYLVSGILGEGGMGIVFDAEQVYFGRRVALKMIKPVLASDPMAERAFFREAVITSRLDHPGIIPVHDFGVSQDGRALYAMMKASGVPWHSVIREKSLSENLAILDRVADVVAYAHLQGVLHRDIKPANVLLGEHGEIWLCDWGVALARLPDGTYSHARPAGTPAYMPPEMARCDAANIGPASDIYLLGAVLFEILNGCPPHSGTTSAEALLYTLAHNVGAGTSRHELMEVALLAMSMEPHQRFFSVWSFQSAIKKSLDNRLSAEHIKSGNKLLAQASEEEDYDLFSRAISFFEQALTVCPENQEAKRRRIKAIITYSETANELGEYALAESLLQPYMKIKAIREQAAKVTATAKKARRRGRNRKAAAWGGGIALLLGLCFAGDYYYFLRPGIQTESPEQQQGMERHIETMKKQAVFSETYGYIKNFIRNLEDIDRRLLKSTKPAALKKLMEYIEEGKNLAFHRRINDEKDMHAICREVAGKREVIKECYYELRYHFSNEKNGKAWIPFLDFFEEVLDSLDRYAESFMEKPEHE